MTPRAGHVTVLGYHSIADRAGDPVLADYAVPADVLAAQLDALRERGWTFVDLDALLRLLAGEERVPKRSLLLTFDDCYEDLLSAALPLLVERGIPALAFAVAGNVGQTNAWDQRVGAECLPLLDAAGLATLSAAGVEVGSHGSSHTSLPALSGGQLRAELKGSRARLQALGLPSPRALAYPYGEWTPKVAAAAMDAGYSVAFTASAGRVSEACLPFALPRVEVFRSDSMSSLTVKLATAGWPVRLRRRLMRRLGIRG